MCLKNSHNIEVSCHYNTKLSHTLLFKYQSETLQMTRKFKAIRILNKIKICFFALCMS